MDAGRCRGYDQQMRKLLCLLPLLLLVGCGDDEPGRDGGNVYPDFNTTFVDTGGGGGCGPASCTGCCQGTTCVSVTTASACGYGGQACQQCQPGQTCPAGICSGGACSASSCPNGCCDSSGQCQSGSATTACGSGGESCKTCSSSEECSKGKCATKGPTMYKVTLVSAKVSGCGWTDTCDAFVILKVGGTTKTSKTKEDTESPAWNEYMLTESETNLTKGFDVQVMDEDVSWHDTIGTCKPSITSTILQSGKLVTTCGDAKSLTFKFE